MPSFRSPKAQANHAVSRKCVIGTVRHGNRDDSLIHSVGTAVAYSAVLSSYCGWLQSERLGDLAGAGRDVAVRYLEYRSTEVGQSQLDKDRQAIQVVIGEKLPRLKSEVEVIRGSRFYTNEQLDLVKERQSPTHAFATALIQATGLRSHELLSLKPASEDVRSGHREWRKDIHSGLSGVLYVTTGKGGLKRECVIPNYLAAELQKMRLEAPQKVTDRGVHYLSEYGIGGHKWSQSFSAASSRALGWSAGGHAIRATWACNRVEQLQSMGYSLDDAKAITSQNLGHFRPDVLEYYL